MLHRPAETSPWQTRRLIAGVALLHLAAGWALLQVPAVRAPDNHWVALAEA